MQVQFVDVVKEFLSFPLNLTHHGKLPTLAIKKQFDATQFVIEAALFWGKTTNGS